MARNCTFEAVFRGTLIKILLGLNNLCPTKKYVQTFLTSSNFSRRLLLYRCFNFWGTLIKILLGLNNLCPTRKYVQTFLSSTNFSRRLLLYPSFNKLLSASLPCKRKFKSLRLVRWFLFIRL